MRASSGGCNVLFVSSVGHLGGSTQSLVTLLRHLGPDVHRVLASPKGLPLADLAAVEGFADDLVDIANMNAKRWLRAPTTMTRVGVATFRRRRTLNVVHANSVTDAALVAPPTSLARMPMVVWAHDGDPVDLAERRSRLVPIFRSFGSRVRWAAVSQASADALVDEGYARSERVTVVANPIDPATTLVERVPSIRLRIGFLGAPTARKGFGVLPGVARGLDPSAAVLKVFTRRHPWAPPPIARIWAELDGLPDRVALPSRQDDIRDALADCDIVLCPTRHESFCRTAAEAMLNGIPVVASDIPAVREVVGDDAGILVDPGDVDGFLGAIRGLAADDAKRERMGQAGRRRAAAFAPATVVRQLEELYGCRHDD